MSDPKDPIKVRAGAIGAAKRWGPRRVVRLDSLTPDQRRLVLAMVDAQSEKAAPALDQPGTALEVRRVPVEPSV